MKKRNPYLFLAAAALAVAGLLPSCGGGGGGGGAPPPTPAISSGMISGTGSIIVNGIEYDTAAASVYLDGVLQPDDGGLKVGMMVKVKGSLTGPTTGSATEVRMTSEVRGTASGAVAGNAGFTVLSQAVTVTASTLFDNTAATLADLTPLNGQVVEVNGVFESPGAIRATRVEVKPAGLSSELKGVVEALSSVSPPGTFSVGGQAVRFDNATILDISAGAAFDNGAFVEVKGIVVEGVLQAAGISAEDLGTEAEGRHVEVKGIVLALNAKSSTFEVAGPTGSISVSYAGLTVPGLAIGQLVEAEGPVTSGILLAIRVRVENELEVQNRVKMVVLIDNVTVTGPNAGTLSVIDRFSVRVTPATTLVGVADMNALAAQVQAAQAANSDVKVEILGAMAGAFLLDAAQVKVVALDQQEFVRGPVEAHDGGIAPVNVVVLGLTLDTTAVTKFRNAAGNPITRAAFFGQLVDGATAVKLKATNAPAFLPPSTLVLGADAELEVEPLS